MESLAKSTTGESGDHRSGQLDTPENSHQHGEAQVIGLPAPTLTAIMPLAGITIGERHWRDLGDITSLARDIGENGLLHPVVIAPDGWLIAGARRLAALRRLGRTEVPATIVTIDSIARGESSDDRLSAYCEQTR
jgi:hypothetical protein